MQRFSFWISVFLGIMLCFCVSVAPSRAADSLRVGVVDFQKVLEQSGAGKAAKDQINREGKKMEEELKDKGEEIDTLEKKLEGPEAVVMSREMREEKKSEIDIKKLQFNKLKKKYVDDFKEMEVKTIRRIQEEVLVLIEELGKKDGFQLIVEKREGGVLYYPGTIDLTDTLIEQYDAKPGKKTGEAPKSGSAVKGAETAKGKKK